LCGETTIAVSDLRGVRRATRDGVDVAGDRRHAGVLGGDQIGQGNAALIHHADSVVAVVSDVEVAVAVDGDAAGIGQLRGGRRPTVARVPIRCIQRARGGEDVAAAVGRHRANGVIAAVGDVDIPQRIDGNAGWIVQRRLRWVHAVRARPGMAHATGRRNTRDGVDVALGEAAEVLEHTALVHHADHAAAALGDVEVAVHIHGDGAGLCEGGAGGWSAIAAEADMRCHIVADDVRDNARSGDKRRLTARAGQRIVLIDRPAIHLVRVDQLKLAPAADRSGGLGVSSGLRVKRDAEGAAGSGSHIGANRAGTLVHTVLVAGAAVGAVGGRHIQVVDDDVIHQRRKRNALRRGLAHRWHREGIDGELNALRESGRCERQQQTDRRPHRRASSSRCYAASPATLANRARIVDASYHRCSLLLRRYRSLAARRTSA
jgi:hypothetical protein